MKYLKILLPIILFFSLTPTAHLQETCTAPTLTNGTYLHANNLRALLAASGSGFWDGSDGQFLVDGPNPYTTIFAQGIWLGNFNPSGDLHLSAATYGASSGRSDFSPGPLAPDTGTTSPENCQNFNRVWSVTRQEIEQHLADRADNGILDDPLPAIMAWPGMGNSHSLEYNGFELPNHPSGLAPFFDQNQNGIYDPLTGDYPALPENVSAVLPEQIIWSVFNSITSEVGQTSGLSWPFEIQQTSWAFYCEDNRVLNNSIFSEYKLLNYGTEPADSTILGFWNDFDLGCYLDDYVGCDPMANSFFVYNADNEDGPDCPNGVAETGDNPPVQSGTILDQSLSSFITIANPTSGNPPATLDPGLPNEFYSYLSGRFRDNTPITEGGSGYNPDSTNFTNFQFPGDPNDPQQWSALQANQAPADVRALANVNLGTVLPGQISRFTVAWSLHREPEADYLGNVTAMYADVAQLQSDFDSRFEDICTVLSPCEDDCVWTGDINADGIADYKDLIDLGFALGESETPRDGPYNWQARPSTPWTTTQTVSSANTKHADANGDGTVSTQDIDKLIQHYALTNPNYTFPVSTRTDGDDLEYRRLVGDLLDLEAGESFPVIVRYESEDTDFVGLSYEIRYDPLYIESITSNGSSGVTSNRIEIAASNGPRLEYAKFLLTDDANIDGNSLVTTLRVVPEFPADLPSVNTEICLWNIKAYRADGTEVELTANCVPVTVDAVVSTDQPIPASAIQLAPNPTTGIVQIATEVSLQQVEVLDYQGRVLRTQQGPIQQVDLTGLAKGLYLLRLQAEEGWVTRKVVKQ